MSTTSSSGDAVRYVGADTDPVKLKYLQDKANERLIAAIRAIITEENAALLNALRASIDERITKLTKKG